MQEMVEIAVFPSRLEAETIGHALDEHGIPFLIQSHDVGMFGPGMVGYTPGGASLRVPSSRLEEVRELISCVVKPLSEDELPEELRADAEEDGD
ncbi:MAG: hypothetical protein AAGM22_22080 [Acidobacteriota bacterium]